MAQFFKAFDKTFGNEGGLTLTNVKGDKGGMTFAGISRVYWPKWDGWELIDKGDKGSPELVGRVRQFYRAQFWTPIKGDDIKSDAIASSIFDFAVNGGVVPAVKLAQLTCHCAPDGVMGPATIARLNLMDDALFEAVYTLQKIRHYAHICNENREQSKFLLGWVNRALTMAGLDPWK